MAKQEVILTLDTGRMQAQLAILRTLASQVGFALDTAILSLAELRADPELSDGRDDA